MPPAKGFRPRHRLASERSTHSLAPYVRTMPVVIDAMLQLGHVTDSDCVYDLGCGDGRIALAAAQACGARGVGVDINSDCIRMARQQARQLELGDLLRFHCGDLMQVDLRPATVVTLYLLPDSNLKLRDKLQTELAPGSRILSHSFDMGDWEPTATSAVSDAINTYPIYLWVV